MPRYSAQYLLEYLRSAEDPDNIAWSVRFIAKNAGMSPTTVQTGLRSLLRSRRIALVRRGFPNTYRIVKTETDK